MMNICPKNIMQLWQLIFGVQNSSQILLDKLQNGASPGVQKSHRRTISGQHLKSLGLAFQVDQGALIEMVQA